MISARDPSGTSGAQARLQVLRPPPPGDRAIVEGLQSRENWARAALFDRHAGDVERVLARILGRDPDLQDLVQDVFLRALESVDRMQEPEKLRSWMVGIAVFTARERIRARRRSWWTVLFSPAGIEEAAAQCDDDPSVELILSSYRALDKLPADERIALALRMIEGMELTEIAEACGVSLATVKRRLARAQERFRERARAESVLRDWMQGESQ
jgi:RNA polymerase sigma-70 factor (ECF subfamily)